MTMDEKEKLETPEQFRLEEYKSLRREIEALQSEARLVAQIALGGGIAIYAWLATHEDQELARIGWWVPVSIPVFVLAHFIDHIYKVDRIAQYIREYIELNPGWESFVQCERNKANESRSFIGLPLIWIKNTPGLKWLKRSPGSIVYLAFWFVLFLLTSAIAMCYSLGDLPLIRGCC